MLPLCSLPERGAMPDTQDGSRNSRPTRQGQNADEVRAERHRKKLAHLQARSARTMPASASRSLLGQADLSDGPASRSSAIRPRGAFSPTQSMEMRKRVSAELSTTRRRCGTIASEHGGLGVGECHG
jgi:hypothetical protein